MLYLEQHAVIQHAVEQHGVEQPAVKQHAVEQHAVELNTTRDTLLWIRTSAPTQFRFLSN
jgi:hypothetical protein